MKKCIICLNKNKYMKTIDMYAVCSRCYTKDSKILLKYYALHDSNWIYNIKHFCDRLGINSMVFP
jgi:GT2 family glycosyltransferase